jgi:hypothetical protein
MSLRRRLKKLIVVPSAPRKHLGEQNLIWQLRVLAWLKHATLMQLH